MLAVALEKKQFVLSRFIETFSNTINLDKFYKELVTKFYPLYNVIYKENQEADRVYLVIRICYKLCRMSNSNT